MLNLFKSISSLSTLSLIGIIASRVLSFFINVLLTRKLGVEDYGYYSLGFSIVSVVQIFSLAGFHRGVLRYIGYFRGQKSVNKLRGISKLGVLVPLILSFLFSIFLFAFSERVSIWFSKPRLSYPLKIFSFTLPPSTVLLVMTYILRGFEQIDLAIILKDIFMPALKLLVFGILLYFGFGLFSIIYGIGLVSILGVLIGAYFLGKILLRLPKSNLLVSEIKQLSTFSFFTFIVSLSILSIGYVDQILLGRLGGVDDLGIYAAASKVAVITTLMLGAFQPVVSPVFAKLSGRDDFNTLDAIYSNVTRWIFGFSIPIVLIMILYSKNIMSLFGPEFINGDSVLIILSLGGLSFALAGPADNLLIMTGHQKIDAINSIASLTLLVGLSLWLIPINGVIGGAISLSVSKLLLSIMRLIEVRYIFGFSPFNVQYLKLIFAAFISLIFYLFLHNFFSPIWVISLLLILIIYFSSMLLMGIEDIDKIAINNFININRW